MGCIVAAGAGGGGLDIAPPESGAAGAGAADVESGAAGAGAGAAVSGAAGAGAASCAKAAPPARAVKANAVAARVESFMVMVPFGCSLMFSVIIPGRNL